MNTNNPYHIEIWNFLDDTFNLKWKIYSDSKTDKYNLSYWNRDYIALCFYLSDVFLKFDIHIYWNGKIELFNLISFIKDNNGECIKWQLNDKYRCQSKFDNYEQFKEFIEYNYNRFSKYL